MRSHHAAIAAAGRADGDNRANPNGVRAKAKFDQIAPALRATRSNPGERQTLDCCVAVRKRTLYRLIRSKKIAARKAGLRALVDVASLTLALIFGPRRWWKPDAAEIGARPPLPPQRAVVTHDEQPPALSYAALRTRRGVNSPLA